LIPKLVHLTWKTKDIFDSQTPLVVNGVRKLVDLNPDWQVAVYDDDEVDLDLKNCLDKKDYDLLQDVHIVAKTDIWRLLKIYIEGGLYIDIDRLYNISLSNIITSDSIKWVLPTYLDFDFSHDFMCSAPNNPVYLQAINMYLERRKHHTSVYFLGPQTYMHAITKSIFGEEINTNPGIEGFARIREIINQMPFIVTYRETPPYDTIVYKDNNSGLNHEALKRTLYKDFNLKHWTGEW
jgi:mannosyltransferase OCH1-like enzyme